jgi:hypothetical protein
MAGGHGHEASCSSCNRVPPIKRTGVPRTPLLWAVLLLSLLGFCGGSRQSHEAVLGEAPVQQTDSALETVIPLRGNWKGREGVGGALRNPVAVELVLDERQPVGAVEREMGRKAKYNQRDGKPSTGGVAVQMLGGTAGEVGTIWFSRGSCFTVVCEVSYVVLGPLQVMQSSGGWVCANQIVRGCCSSEAAPF